MKTTMILAGSAMLLATGLSAPVAAAPVPLPAAGECYNLTKQQNESSSWIGGTKVDCAKPHQMEFFAAVTLPERALESETVAVRMATWTCREQQMAHGALTRLNGSAYGFFVNEQANPDGSKSVVATCAAMMSLSNKWGTKKTDVAYADSGRTGRFCVEWNGRNGRGFRITPAACKNGNYALTKFVNLNKTFDAKYPGRKAIDRKTRALCDSQMRTWPDKEGWKKFTYGSCWKKL